MRIKAIIPAASVLLIPLLGISQEKKPLISATEKVTLTDGRVLPAQYLSEEEKKKPYAKYFYMPMAKPDPAMVDSINKGPIDPARALPFSRLNDLLKPGYLASEIGYCQLPDGTGYVSSIVQMPGVTPEMLDWWFAWHQLDPLRYKIWDHYVHYDVEVDDQDRAKLTSEALPVGQRNWGVTHHINEDIGMGAFPLQIHFISPKEMGFDMSQFIEPNVSTAICSRGMVHIARRVKGGIELRTRFWFPAQGRIPVAMLRGLNYHALEEYTNLAKILPLLYAEYGPKVSN